MTNKSKFIRFMDKLESITRETGVAISAHDLALLEVKPENGSCYISDGEFEKIAYCETKEDNFRERSYHSDETIYVHRVSGTTELQVDEYGGCSDGGIHCSMKYSPLGGWVGFPVTLNKSPYAYC